MKRTYLFVVTVAICFELIATHSFAQLAGQETPRVQADLIPIVDTIWTRSIQDIGLGEFQASTMGGVPRVLLVATSFIQGTADRRILAMDPLSGDTIRSVPSGHGASVQHMSFARNANVYSTAESGRIKVWRWPEMAETRDFQGPSVNRTAGLLTSDGNRLYDAAAGIMYDVLTGDTIWKWKPSLNFARPKITPDDRYLIVHDGHPDFPYQDRAVLLDAFTGQVLATFPGGSGSELIDAMAVSDEGRYVAVSRLGDDSPPSDGSVYVYDRQQQQTILRKQYSGYEIGGFELVFTPNSTGLLVVTRGMTNECDIEWFPAWQTEPQKCFAWMGAHFSSDFTLNYNGFGGGRIGVSRFNLGTVPVEGQHGSTSDVVYPNPTDGTIHLNIANVPDGPVRYEIAALNGQSVSSGIRTVIDGSCSIILQPPLSPGLYSLRLLRGPNVVFSSTLIAR